jgi:hypothetical protein
MPNSEVEVGLGSVVRFGRIPFKLAKIVLNVEEEIKRERME